MRENYFSSPRTSSLAVDAASIICALECCTSLVACAYTRTHTRTELCDIVYSISCPRPYIPLCTLDKQNHGPKIKAWGNDFHDKPLNNIIVFYLYGYELFDDIILFARIPQTLVRSHGYWRLSTNILSSPAPMVLKYHSEIKNNSWHLLVSCGD